MTPAEFAALPIGSPVSDGKAGVGTVFEKKIEWCTITWTAPPARSYLSALDYDDPQINKWTSP